MNFFRKLLNNVSRRQVIADVYDLNKPLYPAEQEQHPSPKSPSEPFPSPEQPPEKEVPPEGGATPKKYVRNPERSRKLRHLRQMDKAKGKETVSELPGYTNNEVRTVLPRMMEALRPFYNAGESLQDLENKHEFDSDFQSSFYEEYFSDYWRPMLIEAINRLNKQMSIMPQNEPTLVDPGDPSKVRPPQTVQIYSREEMKDIIDQYTPPGKDFPDINDLPEEVRNVPDNMRVYEDVIKQIETSKRQGVEQQEKEKLQEEQERLRGVAPSYLADYVIENFILADEERVSQLKNNLGDVDWTSELAQYVFKGVDGGAGQAGQKDFRIRFFLEPKGGQRGQITGHVDLKNSNLDLAPPEVQEYMQNNYPEGYSLNSNQVYRDLYNNFIESLTNRILEIATPSDFMGEDDFMDEGDDEGPYEQSDQDRLFNYILAKIKSKDIERSRNEFSESAQLLGGDSEEGEATLESTIQEREPVADFANMSEEDRKEYLGAAFGNLSDMGNQVRDLSKDIRDHLFESFGSGLYKRDNDGNIIYDNKGNPKMNRQYFAALTLDAIGDLTSTALNKWSEEIGGGNLSPEEINRLIQGRNVSRMGRGKQMKEKKQQDYDKYLRDMQMGKLKYNIDAEDSWSSVNWGELIPPFAVLEQMQAIKNDKIEGDEEDPNSYRNHIKQLDHFKGVPFDQMDIEDPQQKHPALIGYAAQTVAQDIEDYIMDEAFQKYPKNVILALLDAAKSYAGLTSSARYTVFNEKGDQYRTELLTEMLNSENDYEWNPQSKEKLQQILQEKGMNYDIDSLSEGEADKLVDNLSSEEISHAVAPEVIAIRNSFNKNLGGGMWNAISNILSLPSSPEEGKSPTREQREEWNRQRDEYLGKPTRRKRSTDILAYRIMKYALSKLENLSNLKKSMSKFADTSTIDADIARIRFQAKFALKYIRKNL